MHPFGPPIVYTASFASVAGMAQDADFIGYALSASTADYIIAPVSGNNASKFVCVLSTRQYERLRDIPNSYEICSTASLVPTILPTPTPGIAVTPLAPSNMRFLPGGNIISSSRAVSASVALSYTNILNNPNTASRVEHVAVAGPPGQIFTASAQVIAPFVPGPTPTPTSEPPGETCDLINQISVVGPTNIDYCGQNTSATNTLYQRSNGVYYLDALCQTLAEGTFYVTGTPTTQFYNCGGGICEIETCSEGPVE